MNRLFVIPFVFSLLAAGRSLAQEKGNVAIHTDPRLALVLSRSKAVERADDDEVKIAPAKKVKNKTAASISIKPSNRSANTTVTTQDREPIKKAKAVYNPEEDDAIVEKPTRGKHSAEKDDKQERIAYTRAKAAEKENITNEKSNEEEIRAYREGIEKERGEKGPSKKIGKSGIAADEVRYLTTSVSGTSRGGRYNGNGFRVQIYYGTSREEAMRRKAEFMRHYPGVPTYFSYATPTYRVKVGDYRRREDAISMFREANGTYSPCMIVPDNVAIH